MSDKKFMYRGAFILALIGLAFGGYNYYRATVAEIAIKNLETRVDFSETILSKILTRSSREQPTFEFSLPTTRIPIE